MKTIRCLCLLLVAGAAVSGCKKKEPTPPTPTAATPQPTNQTSSSGNPITAPVDYLGAVSKAQQHAVKTLDTAQLKHAIQAFYASEDRYPQSLNELVTTRYLPRLPQPPPRMKFDYNPKTGDIKVVPQ